MSKIITDSFYKLLSYCEKEEFKGYDPYDGLNSRFFRSLPYIRNNRLARLAWIQAFKRSPVNLRSFVGIKKDYNPKAVGLFLAATVIFIIFLHRRNTKRKFISLLLY
jgi:hypothetical protein